ncbi:MAG: PAS domain S-box protein [Bacteroidales bacterium]|nr:PAS domain S-box protein [Bacteroidales bacterium]
MSGLNKYKYSIFLFLFIFTFKQGNAQERGLLLSSYYSSVDYNAGNQNWAILQDKRGVMYFANSTCVLEYDGNTWRQIPVSNNSSVRALAIDDNNVIYVGAYNEFGYLTPDNTGKLFYKSLVQLMDSSYLNFGDVWSIYHVPDGVFFLTDKYLFQLKNNRITVLEKSKERFYLSHKIKNNLYVQEIGNGLLQFNNDSLKLIEKGSFFADKRIHSILPYDNNLLICTRTKGLYLYDNSGKTAQIKSISDISASAKNLNNYLIQNVFYCGIKLTDELYALSTVAGNVLIVDKNWNVTDNINNESTGIISPAHSLYYHENQSLWLALANGISQVEVFSPFRYWNDEKGISGTITDVAGLDGNLYISTGSGLFLTKREADNINYATNKFSPVKGKFEQSWSFSYFNLPGSEISTTLSSKYKSLLAATSQGLFQIKGDNSVPVSKYKTIFSLHQYKNEPSELFLGMQNGIARISYKNNSWIDQGLQFDIGSMIRDINEDSAGNLWFSAPYKGVYRVKNPLNNKGKDQHVELYDTCHGLADIRSAQIGKIENKLIFVDDNNYYVFNSLKSCFDIYDLQGDHESDTVPEEEPEDSLSGYRIADEINSMVYVITLADNSVLWFGTTQGTFRFIENNTRNYSDVFPAIIRNVISGDSVIYNGTNYTKINSTDSVPYEFLINPKPEVAKETVLDFNNNSLTFFYSMPFYEQESKTVFSFYLEGYDKEWSDWNSETKREYTYLREGDYTFKVKSKNIYQIESPVAEFKFKILPPWYRSFAAILGYILLGILLIIVIVRLYTYRLIKEKDKLEKIVIERTQEILMQKEEIMVQAEHLKDANEGITAKNEELEKQKWEITNQAIKLQKANVELIKLSKVASETDNAIAIFDKDGNMEWVNDGFTRMYGYTFMQYSKEKNINIITGSGNPNIQEAVKVCITDKKSVVYEFKTKTRAGKEVWAQTTLTHLIDKNGETINLIAIDSDITKIKQAEREILKQHREIEEQRDKLAISNATKNKFFRIIAHDLRNPISTLAGSTNLIFNDFDEYNKEQTKGFIGELNKLSLTTFNLLENLLDWSSTQMGDIVFSPKPVDLQLIINENIELINRKVNSKNIRLITNIKNDPIAFSDENMIKTVIRNLLSNAVKFTPENGKIEISVNVNNDYINCSVKDSGIGISREDQKKLFRIDTHHSTPGLSNEKGSGLGLILCKEFIEKNGGEISVSSTPQKGTTITFTLKKHTS